jgi:hypothetical protein
LARIQAIAGLIENRPPVFSRMERIPTLQPNAACAASEDESSPVAPGELTFQPSFFGRAPDAPPLSRGALTVENASAGRRHDVIAAR